MDSNLPVEITAKIFGHYLEGPRLYHVLEITNGPFVLASVCKCWREICFSTCSLWASMRIYDKSTWHEEGNIRFLQRWLSRAGTHPLDLNVDVYPLWSTKNSRMFPLFLQHSSQWRTLRLRLQISGSFPTDIVVPCLKTLVITVINPNVSGTVTAFRDAPSLREVSFTDLGRSQSITLPYIQLTHLELFASPLENCLEILRKTPNLEVLNISPEPSVRPLALSPSPLALSHLHTFRLSHLHSWGLSGSKIDLLDHLILPAVVALHLQALKSTSIPQPLALAIRSPWTLRSIRLSFMGHEVSTLCFRGLPSLEKIEIDAAYTYSDLASLFDLLTSDDEFLPALRELAISQCRVQISSSALAEMLASRWRGKREWVARLKSFCLSFFSYRDISTSALDKIKNRVRSLAEEDLDVKVGIGIHQSSHTIEF